MIPLRDINPTRRVPVMTILLIAINALVFFYELSLSQRGLQQLTATALDKLKKFDLDLRKRTDTTSNQLFLSGAEEAPAAYRPQVDEYYRALSKKTGGGSTPAPAPAQTPAKKGGGQ